LTSHLGPFASLVVGGCAGDGMQMQKLTADEIRAAEYGELCPFYDEAIRAWLGKKLSAPPDSIRFGEPRKGYAYLMGRREPPAFGWIVEAGSDDGERRYAYLFQQRRAFPQQSDTRNPDEQDFRMADLQNVVWKYAEYAD
jgi:hypothetical protein